MPHRNVTGPLWTTWGLCVGAIVWLIVYFSRSYLGPLYGAIVLLPLGFVLLILLLIGGVAAVMWLWAKTEQGENHWSYSASCRYDIAVRGHRRATAALTSYIPTSQFLFGSDFP